MIRKVLLVLLFFIHYTLLSQVSIGSFFPGPHTQLDVVASNRGILIPRIALSDITKPDPFDTIEKAIPESLLIYNTEESSSMSPGFYYWYKDQWNKIITAMEIKSVDSVITVNRIKPGLPAQILTTNKNNTVGWSAGAVPIGLISMWSGLINEIPKGWHLCDGTNGNPDLRGRFIVGYSSEDRDYNSIGKHGGLKAVTLSSEQMPKHSHQIYDPGHTHTFVRNYGKKRGGRTKGTESLRDAGSDLELNKGWTGIKIMESGMSQAHENRPPYFTLAYIIFTSK